MANETTILKNLIRTEADRLLCETHPRVCALRDENYLSLEGQILGILHSSKEALSVQTALAQLEQELGETA